jgi:polar amino acid transport system substrate-binding protein
MCGEERFPGSKKGLSPIKFDLSTPLQTSLKIVSFSKLEAVMKKLLICGVVFMVLIANMAHSEETLTACCVDYPPFVIQGEEGKLTGVIPEALEIIFKKFNITFDAIMIGNWKRCQYSVRKGRIDMFMAAVINEERQSYAVYTRTPIISTPTVIFVWKGKEFGFEQWEDLTGKKAGIRLGISFGKDFDTFLEKNMKEISKASTDLQLYKMLEAGRIDFVPNGLYAGLMTIKKSGFEGKIVPLEIPINEEDLYAPISKKSRYLKYLPQYEAELEKLRADGTIDRLVDKYMKSQLLAE